MVHRIPTFLDCHNNRIPPHSAAQRPAPTLSNKDMEDFLDESAQGWYTARDTTQRHPKLRQWSL